MSSKKVRLLACDLDSCDTKLEQELIKFSEHIEYPQSWIHADVQDFGGTTLEGDFCSAEHFRDAVLQWFAIEEPVTTVLVDWGTKHK